MCVTTNIDSGQVLICHADIECIADSCFVLSMSDLSINIDTVPPLIFDPIFSNFENCDSILSISFSVADSGLGVDRSAVLVYVDGVLQYNHFDTTSQLHSATIPFGLQGEQHNLTIVASDIPGNQSSIESIFYGGLYGYLSGSVIDDSSEGLAGVVVSLIDNTENLFATATTDSCGHYSFFTVPVGEYNVAIVMPLGYVTLSDAAVETSVVWNQETVIDFQLQRTISDQHVRTAWWWWYQVAAAIHGWHCIQESPDDLEDYRQTIHEHFDPHFSIYADVASLEDMKEILSAHLWDPVSDQAKKHFYALLLNAACGRLATYRVISPNGATASQAITFIADLIENGDSGDDWLAALLAGLVNARLFCMTGDVIPADIEQIAYKMFEYQENDFETENTPIEFSLEQNYPNPFNPDCEIKYSLPKDANVCLSIYNLLGQKVRILVDEFQLAGHKTVHWDGTHDNGNAVASGIYFYRIKAGSFTETKKMVLMK
jgi:hypothetical protein